MWYLEDDLELVDFGTEEGESGKEPAPPSSQVELAIAKNKSRKTRPSDLSPGRDGADEMEPADIFLEWGMRSSDEGDEGGIEEVKRKGAVPFDLSMKFVDVQRLRGRRSSQREGRKGWNEGKD